MQPGPKPAYAPAMLRQLAIPFTCLMILAACSTDPGDDSASAGETVGDGDGDPTGDGDGDPSGDGDGDPSGDGDGDPSGDGDGDPSGDGDGDPSGDGDGDGDGDPNVDTEIYDGEYLLALSTTLDPNLPLQFIVTVDAGTTLVDLSIQPLSLDVNQTTTPRLPVGDPLVYNQIPHVDGVFTLDLGTVMVPGAANPITGSNITVAAVLAGSFVSETAFCGTITGDVMQPIVYDLVGSTFAAVEVEDTSPAALPVDIALSCADVI
jgi:hypothetical protein